MLHAALLAASIALTALAPAPPAADGLPPAVLKTLPPRWSTAFDNPACSGVKRVSLSAQQATVASQCLAIPGCVAHAAEGGEATLVATMKIAFVDGTYKLVSQLVEVGSGKVLTEFSPPNVATANALDGAFGAAARKLCSTLVKATPGADLELAEVGFDDLPPLPTDGAADPAVQGPKRPKPAKVAAADLDLELDVPKPAAKPAPAALPDLDLDIPAEPVKVAVAPKAPEPKKAPEVAPPPAKTETILAAAPAKPAPPSNVFVAPPVEPEPPASSVGSLQVGAWIAGGVAVLAGGGGAMFGKNVLAAAKTRDAALDYPGFAAAQADAERSGTYANVSFGVAATAAVTSGILFALANDLL